MSEWQPIETLPRRGKVEAKTCRGEIIVGRAPASRGKVRDINTVEDATGLRHVCTHWRPVSQLLGEDRHG